MRIAITLGTLRIPPTYFALEHARFLQSEHALRAFALVSEIRDRTVRNDGVDVVDVVPFRTSSFRLREFVMPAYLGVLTRAIRAYRPDVIHQHFGTWSWSAVDASEQGIPMIVTVHGADVFAALRPLPEASVRDRPMLRWHKRNTSRSFKSARRILAVSEFLAGEAVRAGAPADRVLVHYQGIDTDYFTPDKSVGEPADDAEPEVVFVGALVPRKGISDLLEASIGLVASHPHQLRFIGAGPLLSAVQEAAERHPHVRALGSLPRADIRDRLRKAAVLVLPTQKTGGWREAAGLVLLEAQACGTPVVAYDSGGTSEMLRDGKTGLLVQEFDRRGLGEAIGSILSAKGAEKEAMGRQAREFVVGERSVAAGAGQLDEYYRDLG